MPKVEKTPQAEADAIAIWLYIAEDNPNAATETLYKFERRLESLARLPLTGEAVSFIAPNVRRVSVGNYVIYYRPLADGIQVLRILHGARRPEDLL